MPKESEGRCVFTLMPSWKPEDIKEQLKAGDLGFSYVFVVFPCYFLIVFRLCHLIARPKVSQKSPGKKKHPITRIDLWPWSWDRKKWRRTKRPGRAEREQQLGVLRVHDQKINDLSILITIYHVFWNEDKQISSALSERKSQDLPSSSQFWLLGWSGRLPSSEAPSSPSSQPATSHLETGHLSKVIPVYTVRSGKAIIYCRHL